MDEDGRGAGQWATSPQVGTVVKCWELFGGNETRGDYARLRYGNYWKNQLISSQHCM